MSDEFKPTEDRQTAVSAAEAEDGYDGETWRQQTTGDMTRSIAGTITFAEQSDLWLPDDILTSPGVVHTL